MDKRFVKAYRDKWVDRGPVKTLRTRAGTKTGRFGIRRSEAMNEGELDKWNNRIASSIYWRPMVMSDGDPNKRDVMVTVWGRKAAPFVMTSGDYQKLSDDELDGVF